MIPAPRLYPDELLGPGLVRCCRWFNLPFKVFARKVLELPGLRANFFSVWPLRKIAPLYGVSPEHLLWSHTSFPYATGFVTGESYDMALRAALDASPGMSHLLAVMQNATLGMPMRRVCLKCVQEDLDRYGETYWHRAHNLPGVLVCVKHKCTLSLTNILACSELKTVYALPIECETVSMLSVGRVPGLVELAKRSEKLLNRHAGQGEARTASSYRALAVSAGWLSPTRAVNEKALCGVVAAAFPNQYIAASGLPYLRKQLWPALAFRPGNAFNLSTVRHLMLETALSLKAPEATGQLDHVPSGPPATTSEALDAFYAPLARKELLQLLREGQVLTTAEFLRRAGALGPYRHRGESLPRLRRVVLEFRASPASVKQLRPGKTLFRNRPSETVPSLFEGHRRVD